MAEPPAGRRAGGWGSLSIPRTCSVMRRPRSHGRVSRRFCRLSPSAVWDEYPARRGGRVGAQSPGEEGSPWTSRYRVDLARSCLGEAANLGWDGRPHRPLVGGEPGVPTCRSTSSRGSTPCSSRTATTTTWQPPRCRPHRHQHQTSPGHEIANWLGGKGDRKRHRAQHGGTVALRCHRRHAGAGMVTRAGSPGTPG